MKKLYLLAFAAWLCVGASAQDARFSQYFASPLNLNPAMTGVFDGKFRVAMNYRDQWSSILLDQPFRTISAGADMRFRVVRDDYFAAGLHVLRDEAGENQFNQTKVYLSTSFLKQLSSNRYRTSDQFLIAGLQLGAGQHGINWSAMSFSQQFNMNTELYDPTLPTGEAMGERQSEFYLDINAGLLWYAVMDDDLSIYAGGALNHINAPNVSFYEDENEQLYMRWVGHAGGEFGLTREMSLLPSIQMMGQGPSFETNFGTQVRYTNRDLGEVAIRMGAFMRIANASNLVLPATDPTATTPAAGVSVAGEAFIVTATLEMERWLLGLSYDVTASSLSTATNSRGAFEMSLIYVQPEQRRFKVACPKF